MREHSMAYVIMRKVNAERIIKAMLISVINIHACLFFATLRHARKMLTGTPGSVITQYATGIFDKLLGAENNPVNSGVLFK